MKSHFTTISAGERAGVLREIIVFLQNPGSAANRGGGPRKTSANLQKSSGPNRAFMTQVVIPKAFIAFARTCGDQSFARKNVRSSKTAVPKGRMLFRRSRSAAKGQNGQNPPANSPCGTRPPCLSFARHTAGTESAPPEPLFSTSGAILEVASARAASLIRDMDVAQPLRDVRPFGSIAKE